MRWDTSKLLAMHAPRYEPRPADDDIGLYLCSSLTSVSDLGHDASILVIVLHIAFSFASKMSASLRTDTPSSILIVGSGAFGLSTAWALCRNPQYKNTKITVVDRQPFPSPDGSSVSCDTSDRSQITNFSHLYIVPHPIWKLNRITD